MCSSTPTRNTRGGAPQHVPPPRSAAVRAREPWLGRVSPSFLGPGIPSFSRAHTPHTPTQHVRPAIFLVCVIRTLCSLLATAGAPHCCALLCPCLPCCVRTSLCALRRHRLVVAATSQTSPTPRVIFVHAAPVFTAGAPRHAGLCPCLTMQSAHVVCVRFVIVRCVHRACAAYRNAAGDTRYHHVACLPPCAAATTASPSVIHACVCARGLRYACRRTASRRTSA